jgi:hypothetical protein
MGGRDFFSKAALQQIRMGSAWSLFFSNPLGAETPWCAAYSRQIVGAHAKDNTPHNFVVVPGGLRYVVSAGAFGQATGCDVHWLPICLGGVECACGQAGYVRHGAHASAPRLSLLFRDGAEVFVDRQNGGNLP